jgi:hypothetical protein
MEGIGLMKKVLLSLAAVSAIAVAAPAVAQPYGNAYGYNNHRDTRVAINQRQNTLAHKIDNAARRGDLQRGEAYSLMGELRQIEAIEQRYRAGGLNRWERDEIEKRLSQLQSRLTYALRNDNRRYGYGYGRW